MAFKIKPRPTGFKKLLLATKKRADQRVQDFAITEAWRRYILSLRPLHRQQLVTRTGAPLWRGPGTAAEESLLLFAPRSLPSVPTCECDDCPRGAGGWSEHHHLVVP
jgi:hypothetical protein